MCEQQQQIFYITDKVLNNLTNFLFILSISNFIPKIILICVCACWKCKEYVIKSGGSQIENDGKICFSSHITSQLLCDALKPDQILKCYYKCVHKACRISRAYVITLFSSAF